MKIIKKYRYQNSISFFFLMLAALSMAGLLFAAERPIEEVQVIGQRTIKALQLKINEAEEKMYQRFNELNDDDIFDITCTMETVPNSDIKHRQCMPNYIRSANKEEVNNTYNMFSGGAYMTWATPMQSVVANYAPQLEDQLVKVLNEDNEFYEAVLEHHELREQYREMTRTYFGKEDDLYDDID